VLQENVHVPPEELQRRRQERQGEVTAATTAMATATRRSLEMGTVGKRMMNCEKKVRVKAECFVRKTVMVLAKCASNLARSSAPYSF
jgi:hypothetical protein